MPSIEPKPTVCAALILSISGCGTPVIIAPFTDTHQLQKYHAAGIATLSNEDTCDSSECWNITKRIELLSGTMLDTCLGNPGPEPKLWREESDLTVEANGASRYVVALTRYQGFDLCTGRPRFDEIYSTALAPIADDDTITYEVAHNQTTTLTLEQFRKNCSEAKLLQEREGILAAQNTSCQLIPDAGAEDGG